MCEHDLSNRIIVFTFSIRIASFDCVVVYAFLAVQEMTFVRLSRSVILFKVSYVIAS